MAAQAIIPLGGSKHRFSRDYSVYRPRDLNFETARQWHKQTFHSGGERGEKWLLLSYKTGNGRPHGMEGPAHLLAPFGFLMAFSFHTSVHRIVEQTYIFISSKVPFGMSLRTAYRCLCFLLQQVEANEAGCVSYADSYKALYGFHTGQWGTQDIFLGFVAV